MIKLLFFSTDMQVNSTDAAYNWGWSTFTCRGI